VDQCLQTSDEFGVIGLKCSAISRTEKTQARGQVDKVPGFVAEPDAMLRKLRYSLVLRRADPSTMLLAADTAARLS
jgi:hypothetical protein